MKETEKKKTTKRVTKKAVEKKVKQPAVVKSEPVKEEKVCCCGKKRMIDEYLDVLAQYLRFGGRLSRRGYWCYVLFNFLFAMLAFFSDVIFKTGGALFLTYALLTTVPSFAAMSRRLHDIGRSMWWCTLPLLILPLVVKTGYYFGAQLTAIWSQMYVVFLFLAYLSVVLSFFLIYFLMRKGSCEANKYGDKTCC